jgi:hypothetical protein
MFGDGIGQKNLELALARKTEVAVDGGLATGGGNTTLDDATKSWTVNSWAGGVIQIIKSDGKECFRNISANTDTQITFAALPVGVVVAAGDLYAIRSMPSTLGQELRWGRSVNPAWTYAAEQVAPGAGTALVTQAVSAAKSGYIYGFFISCQEANNFLLNWTSGGVARSKRIIFGGAGSSEAVDPVALNEGLPADAGTNVTITNVTAAVAGMIYQANLLYGEV